MINPWALQYDPREQAFMLGEFLGIKTTDSTELVQKLSEFHVKDIIAATGEVTKSLNSLSGHLFAFIPSIEADLGQDMFLSTDPWTLLKNGQVADMPVMAGLVADEGVMFAQGVLNHIELLNTEPEMFLPYNLNVTDPEMRKMHGECLKKFYFGDKQVTKENINELNTMIGDTHFNAGQIIGLDMIKAKSSAPIYLYQFNYEAPFGFMKNFAGITDAVAHGDELGYMFYSGAFKNLPEPGSSAEKMTNVVTKLWTNFAKDRSAIKSYI
ncbi:esterase FE4-like [Augochlora pura]